MKIRNEILRTLHSGTDVPLKVAYPVRKKNKNDTFRTRYAKKKSRVPLKLGGSVFEAAEGLREFRVPGTRFFFVRVGYAKNFFRVPGTRKKKVAYPPSWGGRFLIFFKNWACEIPRTRYVCSGM